MEWKKYPKEKPKTDLMCYVTNRRAGVHCYIAIYQAHYDVFMEYNPGKFHNPPIDVTHWAALPVIPKNE
jgi:hypothetical protein